MVDTSCEKCGNSMFLLQDNCDNCGENYEWELTKDCAECGGEVDLAESVVCGDCGSRYSVWTGIEDLVDESGGLYIDKGAVPHPCAGLYVPHAGFPRMQIFDYRKMSGVLGGDFHVVSYRDCYYIHKDGFSAISNPICHVVFDGGSKLLEVSNSVLSFL